MNKTNTVKLTLIRGLPGSGKSTLAQKIAEQTDSVHLETDMYFVDKAGEYRFDPSQLEAAHQWCQQQTYVYLSQGNSVIVSNTFVRHWEMKAYKEIAKKLNVVLEIHVCKENYGSIHDIEPSTIAKMKANWQV
ncbi:ATP-binding protein [Vibrio rumoiensis]|uniref:AAA family ATPase n=1 Tax=Vibrio rumoiensis 1S-45 TaxID=1188252 RepID=A0A1E5E3X7_9VIBR|nr:ATP-binding protein [Vibrio rumoiensis]OEF26818.1 AAA family ATPase [Vibrio rumoiensis 1S-45]